MAQDKHKGRTAVFLHIPKTAGSTMRFILRAQYAKEHLLHLKGDPTMVETLHNFKMGDGAGRENIQLLSGHIEFGIHEYLPLPADYFTLLRDPIDRILSDYYYILRTPTHPRYEEMTRKKMSIEAYIEQGILENAQTRLISGTWLTNPRQCDRKSLEMAKENLKNHFVVVGLTNRFDETLLLLQKALGWQNIVYAKRNVTRNRPGLEAVSDGDLAAMKQVSEFDAELFKYVTQTFDEKLASLGASFERDVQLFRLRLRAEPYLAQIRRVSVRTFIRNAIGR
jgi:hypothetical protein